MSGIWFWIPFAIIIEKLKIHSLNYVSLGSATRSLVHPVQTIFRNINWKDDPHLETCLMHFLPIHPGPYPREGGIRGQCPPPIFVPPKFYCAPKICFKHISKQNLAPLIMYFAPPNFKTCLRTCIQPTRPRPIQRPLFSIVW